ncbi:MAG: sulfatase [Elusimicrobia bacterium GWB2_63_22]|nr:MAG: sulfatase [Elusimicrobia bacterium GWB2_63_22]
MGKSRYLLPWPLLIAASLLAVFTLTRAGLAVYAGPSAVPFSLWPWIFLKGLGFDLPVIMTAVAPVLFYEALLPASWRAHSRHRALKLGAFWALLSLLLFIAAAEAVFWTEFSTRFNFIAVDYLLYTNEVIGNIVQSYPVGWILAAIAALAGLATWGLRRVVVHAGPDNFTKKGRVFVLALAGALPALAYALSDIDKMAGLGNAYADELSGNGVLSFAAALRRNELDYDKLYRTIPQERADAVLKRLGVERSPLSASVQADMFDKSTDPLPLKRRPRNVVIITVESLSASFLGAYGSGEGLTPNLDRLAREGLKFERAFATGSRTVRGLEALSLGIPPIPGQSVVRRPQNGHLSTLGEVLQQQGFSTLFIYGGYGYFDNMNAYFNANEYRIVDRRVFPEASVIFENIWGVADEVLFSNAIAAIDRETVKSKPFFAHIMTTSNHRPYTYPPGRIDIPSPGGRRGAVKYTDYAIGAFIKGAAARPWFKDTLFVITADHCASVAGKTKLPVEKYRIPVILYAPALLKPGAFKHVVSQIDIPPSLIELLGRKGDDYFFGRPFFETGANPERAFISNYQALGYLRRDVLTVLLPRKRVESYHVNPVTLEQTPIEPEPALVEEAVAYYQTASRAFKSGALKLPHPPGH